MVKLSSFRFEQCLGAFTMLPVEAYSEEVFFDINLTAFLESRNFGNALPYECDPFFFEYVQSLI